MKLMISPFQRKYHLFFITIDQFIQILVLVLLE
jgi:hypothetical protein